MITPDEVSRKRSLLVSIIFLSAFFTFAPLPAQTAPAPTSLDTLFKKGADAYNRGDYDTSITSFEQIIKLAKPGPVLEPIYYTITTAKLRKADNDGAIGTFQLYLRTYPSGSQINDARAGLTKALIAAKRMPEALAALRDLRSRAGSQGIDNYAAVAGESLYLRVPVFYPSEEDKMPAALLGAASAYKKLGDEARVVSTLTTLASRFPNSPEAAKAKL